MKILKRLTKCIIVFFAKTLRFIEFLSEFCECFIVGKASIYNPIKKKHCGTIAVLANGPSLKEVLPFFENNEEFRNIDFAAMNYFALEDEAFFKIKPKHYFLFDPIFLVENECMKSAFAGKPQKLYTIIQNKVDWELNIYVPKFYYSEFIEFSRITNKNILILGLNTIDYKGYECFRNFFYVRCLSMPLVQSVLITAIFVSINSGYKNILLYGVEHSFFNISVNEKNYIITKAEHFYKSDNSTEGTSLIDNGVEMKMSTFLEILHRLFKSHDLLANYAYSLKVNIINCTKNSFINSYKRISKDTLPYDIKTIIDHFN
jgi:hypothetical protein